MSNDSLTKQIMGLNESLSEKKLLAERENGKVDAILKELTVDFKIKDIDKARERIEDLSNKLEVLQEDLENDVKEFKGKYAIVW